MVCACTQHEMSQQRWQCSDGSQNVSNPRKAERWLWPRRQRRKVGRQRMVRNLSEQERLRLRRGLLGNRVQVSGGNRDLNRIY